MKIRKIIAPFAVCLALCMTLTACSEIQNALNGTAMELVNAKKVTLTRPSEITEKNVQAAAGFNSFAFRFSAALAREAGEGNFICSPYSAWLPLAALSNATAESEKDALMASLGLPDFSGDDLNTMTSHMLYFLTKRQSNLKIANALFVDKNASPSMDFAASLQNHYGGQMMRVNFAAKQATDAVNQWASDNTDGKINDIIQRFDPATQAAIANAIYFTDDWATQFNKRNTTNNTFHGTSADTTAPFMHQSWDKQTYYEDERLQALPLKFANGGGLYILLPKNETAAELLTSLTAVDYFKIHNKAETRMGSLSLPRFTIKSDIMQLTDALTTLGVPLFDSENPALTGVLAEGDPLFITGAVQKALIEVDEMGATAAAVTVYEMAGAAPPQDPEPPFEMICDKPFVFILYGDAGGGIPVVLFTGMVNDL